MKKSDFKNSPRVFLDASIIVAASISPTGGSFRIFKEASLARFTVATNAYVFDEAVQALQRKYPAALDNLERIVSWCGIDILPDPPEKFVAKYIYIIDADDAPVLAGAIKSKARFLITLDRRNFMTATLHKADLPIIISTPKDFFQKHWQ